MSKVPDVVAFVPERHLLAELEARVGEVFVDSPGQVAARDIERCYVLLSTVPHSLLDAAVAEAEADPTRDRRKHDRTISFRPSARLLPLLVERVNQAGGSWSAGRLVARDLGVYYALLRQSLPRFSLEEALLLVDALNGCLVEPRTVRGLWANVEDAISVDALDQSGGLSAPQARQLVERLRDLPPIACMAVWDAVERAWNARGGENTVWNMQERVRLVGLVRDEAAPLS